MPGTTGGSLSANERSFCLDADLSYRVADALAPFWSICHISAHPENPSTTVGQCSLGDDALAPWIAENKLVYVTIDSGFSGRWVKSGLLSDHGIEAIVFTRDIKGDREQMSRITRHLPNWQEALADYDYGFRVWEQSEHRRLPWIRHGNKTKRPPTP